MPLSSFIDRIDGNAQIQFAGRAFILMFCAGLLLRTPWLPQTVFWLILLPCAGFLARNIWLDQRGCYRGVVRYWLMIGALFVYFLILIASTIISEGTVNQRIAEEIWYAAACLIAVALAAEIIRRDPKFVLTLARFLIVSATAAGAMLLVTASAEISLFSQRLNGFPQINYFLNPNVVGGVYAILFSIALGHLLRGDLGKVERGATLMAALLLAVITFMTGSRGSILACLLATGLGLLALSPRLAVGVGCSLALAAALVAVALPDWATRLIERGDSYRLDLWPRYFEIGLERMWIGHGLAFDPRIQIDNKTIHSPHNILLAAFFRGGAGATLALAVALAAAALAAMAAARRKWWLPAMTFATMIGLGSVDHELLPSTFGYLWYLFWLPLCLCAGACFDKTGGSWNCISGLSPNPPTTPPNTPQDNMTRP